MLKSKSKSQKMREQAGDMLDRLAPHVESARDKAAPVIAEAREKASPAIDSARTKFNSEVLPVITAAVAAAAEATEEARDEARKRGHATAAALKGEVAAPKRKSHKLRKLFLLLGLSGVAAFVAKKMSEREESTAWQSSYTPTPPAPTSTPTAAAAAEVPHPADDEGGAAPDEAAADAAEVPHPATTPENPASEIRVDDDRS